MARKWTWLWISEKNTSLLKLIELLNLRLKALADFLGALVTGSSAGAIEFYGYNDGATLLPGDSDWGYIPVACTLAGAEIVVSPAGSIAFTASTARYPTWETWTVISPTPLTLTSASEARYDLSGWATTITAGTYLKVTVTGAPASVKKFTLTFTLAPV